MKRFLAAFAVLPFLLVASCSAGNSDHNSADIRFAQQMIPHHQQAVEMADEVSGSGASPKVTGLAAQIKDAQEPEIVQMQGWLKDWNAKEPSGDMDMGDGMMSGAEMTSLGQADGPAFDTLWVTLMTKHHEGAIAMARAELKSGVSPDAKALARSIIAAQQKEIATMKELLR